MSLSAGKSRMVTAAKDLYLKWEQTKNYWKDQKSLEFQHKYLELFFIEVEKTVTVVEKLDELLKKVKSDCE